MDIVKRAYLQTFERWHSDPGMQSFRQQMADLMKSWIKARVYSERDWPRELGPLPDELRAKAKKRTDELRLDEIYEALNSSLPFHFPINESTNLYAVNAAVAIADFLKVRGVKVVGCREDFVRVIPIKQ